MSFSSEDGLRDEVGDDDNWADSPSGEQSPRKNASITFVTADAETPQSRPLLAKTRSSKMSFYHKQATWSGKKRRSLYMDDLLLKRQQTIANVFKDQDEEDQDEEKGDIQDSAHKLSVEMHAAFVRHLQSYVKDKDTFAMPSVEIRVKNFSFDVPISQREAEGGTKIPTVFNYSPIYWCKKAGEKCLERNKIESAIRKKEVRSVLTNVNLALEPGKMYLIIGPPSSGKTSLLNGECMYFMCCL